MNLSRSSEVLTEHYRRLAADYFSLGYYCRYTMMTARERKPKSGACRGGHWDMTRRVGATLWGLSICAFGCFIDSVEKFGSTTEY
jgi:hypothetical protein